MRPDRKCLEAVGEKKLLSKNKAMLISENHKVSKDHLEKPQRELASVVTTRVTVTIQ